MQSKMQPKMIMIGVPIRIVAMCVVAMYALVGQVAAQEMPVYEGIVLLPDPFNLAVGVKSTDELCQVSLRHADGDLWVTSSFWEGEKLADGEALRGEDFYLGELDDDGAFVLQLWRDKPVALTQTSYDKKGRLNYGGKGSGNFLRECLLHNP